MKIRHSPGKKARKKLRRTKQFKRDRREWKSFSRDTGIPVLDCRRLFVKKVMPIDWSTCRPLEVAYMFSRFKQLG